MTDSAKISRTLVKLTNNLSNTLKRLPKNMNNPRVVYSYNPTEYAIEPYTEYLNKYCDDTKHIIFVGMNPGPFGMCQTGVPFGEVNIVKNWLKITGEVSKPSEECPNRPVEGFNCSKSEESGFRLWGLFKELCNEPQFFFKNAFVYNYCPLAFFDEKGYNVTPEGICDSATLDDLEEMCDEMLVDVVNLLKPKILVGVGRYAEKRCNIIKRKNSLEDVEVLYLLHPSPRASIKSVWDKVAKDFLSNHDLMQYLNSN